MKKSEANDQDVRLSITPLIDVTFLLLIFFMCAMKFKTLERKVASFLPLDKGLAFTPDKIPVEVQIRVHLKRGAGASATRVKLLDTEIGVGQPAFVRLDEAVRQIRGRKGLEEAEGFIHANPEVPHGDVIRCLDSFMKAGITNVEFRGTAPKGSEPPRAR